MNVSLLGSAREFDEAWRAAWELKNLRKVLGAVAYISDAGARILQNCWRANPTQLILLCGVEEATEGKALARFVEWRGSIPLNEPNVEFAWLAPSRGRFHPKMWLFEARDECRLLIGSSNLTSGGHGGNIEAGVLIHFGVGAPFHFETHEMFANWCKDSILLQQSLVDEAGARDKARAEEKLVREPDAIGRAWKDDVEKAKSDEKSAPLPPIALGIEQRVIGLLQFGVIVELTASARNLYEKFEGNPFDISDSQKVATEVLQITRRDSQKFCVLSAQTKRKLDNSQNGARTALNLFAYKSPWGDFVPDKVYIQWSEKQGGKRAKFKAEIEQQFQTESFWQGERERLRRQIELDSREIWAELHPRRPKMPEKNFKQVIYETQRAFDRRHGELREFVNLHHQPRRVHLDEVFTSAQNASSEVAILLQSHAQNQRELLLRNWMSCLIKQTRTRANRILKDLGELKNFAYNDAQHLADMNFFGDIYLPDFVCCVRGLSLFPEETEQQTKRAELNDIETPTLQWWKQRFDRDLEELEMWREMEFAKVLASFAAMTGWKTGEL